MVRKDCLRFGVKQGKQGNEEKKREIMPLSDSISVLLYLIATNA